MKQYQATLYNRLDIELKRLNINAHIEPVRLDTYSSINVYFHSKEELNLVKLSSSFADVHCINLKLSEPIYGK